MQNDFVIGDRALGASGDTHPLWMVGHAVAGPYLVVGASAVGQIHLARDLPRDDAFVVRSLGPWLAVGVADGVGSRPLSRYGASYVAESLSALLLRHFSDLTKDTDGGLSPDPASSTLSSLAPPPRVEEAVLKPVVMRKGTGIPSLDSGLRSWTDLTNKVKKTIGKADAEEVPAIELQQAASIGWWPPIASGAEESEEEPNQKSSGDTPGTNPMADTVPAGQQPAQAVTGNGVPSQQIEPDRTAIVRNAFEKTHLGLREHASSLGLEWADLSCTALALLLNVETGRGAVGQVGDGAVLGLKAQGNVKELVEAPETDDPQSTYTVNRPNFQDYMVVQVIEPVAVDPLVSFYVMTDGLSGDLLYTPQAEALKNWAQQVDHNLRVSFSPAQAAAGLLNWLATYQVKGSWDDRTLVVITKLERNHGNRHSVTGQSQPAKSTDNQ